MANGRISTGGKCGQPAICPAPKPPACTPERRPFTMGAGAALHPVACARPQGCVPRALAGPALCAGGGPPIHMKSRSQRYPPTRRTCHLPSPKASRVHATERHPFTMGRPAAPHPVACARPQGSFLAPSPAPLCAPGLSLEGGEVAQPKVLPTAWHVTWSNLRKMQPPEVRPPGSLVGLYM
jgi:hypothetical protein